jgi:hypothetical protein
MPALGCEPSLPTHGTYVRRGEYSGGGMETDEEERWAAKVWFGQLPHQHLDTNLADNNSMLVHEGFQNHPS